jgi:hypothetical protein
MTDKCADGIALCMSTRLFVAGDCLLMVALTRYPYQLQWLADGEPFFGWQLLAGELAAGVRVIARETATKQTSPTLAARPPTDP